MLFKLPITLLSNAPKFSALCPNCAPLCPIMLHYALKLIKLLLPVPADKPVSLATYISRQLRALHFDATSYLARLDCSIRVYQSFPIEF